MSDSRSSQSPLLLSDAQLGLAYEVVALSDASGDAERTGRLAELGFLPGEAVSVLAQFKPGNDPLAIRIGLSTFALRRAEAACVQVKQTGAAE